MAVLATLRDGFVKTYSLLMDFLLLVGSRFFPDKLSSLKSPHWLPKEQGNIVITGGNGGLGFESAIFLAKFGHRIIITGRDEAKGQAAVERIREETGNNRIEFFSCDFSSFRSVREVAERINQLNIPIHVLMNNAGIHKVKKEFTHDGLETNFQVNHVSVQLLTTLLLDRIKEAKPPGRIITLSSSMHWFETLDLDDLQTVKKNFGNGLAAYARSKIALILFGKELQRRLIREGRKDILSVLVHPNLVATDLSRETNFGNLIKVIGLPQKIGARGQIYTALAPPENLVPGGYYEGCILLPVSNQANDPILASKLWDITEKLYAGSADSRKPSSESN